MKPVPFTAAPEIPENSSFKNLPGELADGPLSKFVPPVFNIAPAARTVRVCQLSLSLSTGLKSSGTESLFTAKTLRLVLPYATKNPGDDCPSQWL